MQFTQVTICSMIFVHSQEKKRRGMPFGTGLGHHKSHIELLELTLLIFLIFYGFLLILCIPYL